ncbi:PQQ-dependent sugar dehydrogenase [Sphaerisporangium corydalis]|uniref:PQQ-dependent sugar dehydrogenase n=1 Tax=Sphaerisporangium corydalis TaxID=1441875 RepID=A0ABV9EKP5_9ACTN|nr:PQQ-dependent sugar dehydrogenase [Sphaerisporangium corydalis]
MALSALLATGGTAFVLAAGAPAANAVVVNPADYQQVTLAKGVEEAGEPMSLAVLPDRSVVHTARDGTLRRTDAAGTTAVVGKLAVYNHDEEGLQGVGVDPAFATNRRIYLYYAPPLTTPAGDAPATGSDWSAWQGVNRLSRFTLTADWKIQSGSEVKILDVAADRGICCHVGGDIDFDAAGNLYLSTGDDSNPFDSDGYDPIDERANRNPAYDAQRTSANTNDLRGKVLRVKVNDNGTYSIPSGNMFAPGTAATRPEIYAMGFRNPFRLSVDKATGVVYLGDYGPDAGAASATRGPGGQVEFNRITGPGFYGWPYCTGDNTTAETYNEYDFATGTSGAKYNCAAGPANNSFRNTGRPTLPAPKAAWIKYGGDSGSPPEFGGGSESPMGGPVYHYDAALNSPVKFPQALDGVFFAGEFGRGWIKTVEVGSNGSRGAIGAFPFSGKQVMDMAFGPDGALYVLDYGTGYFGGDANSALYRIEYIAGGNRAPTAKAAADRTSGQPPLTVNFSSAGSSDPEGGPLTYAWAFGDGGTSTAANPSHAYTTAGSRTATLTVTDNQGATGTASVIVTVGNTAPSVTFTSPKNGQLFTFGDTVSYAVTVTDPEDGAVDCSKVTVTYLLGHDQHAHAMTSKTGCSGTITTQVDGEHSTDANTFGVLAADYTDAGGLKGTAQATLQPRHRQAEHYGSSSGVDQITHAGAEGGKTVGNIENGDWIAFQPYLLEGATSLTARVSSAGVGGTLEVRAGSATGTLLGSVAVPVTGGWETFQNVTANLSNGPAATTTLYLVFKGGAGALYDLDAFTLAAAASRTGPVKGLAGKCLDVAGAATTDGTQVQLYGCNGTAAQTWTVTGQVLKALGKCLDVAGGATANGTKVQIWTCNGSAAQNWAAQSDGTLRNPQSARCLDVTGASTADATPIAIRDCGTGAGQKWTLP